MEFQTQCEACGETYPVAQMRRLVWVRVCCGCADRLAGAKPPLGNTAAARSAARPRPASAFGMRATWIALAAAAGLAFCGSTVRSILVGALIAELLTWCAIDPVRTPWRRGRFAALAAARVILLALVFAAAALAAEPTLVARFDLAAAAFGAVLLARGAWFASFWADVRRAQQEGDVEHPLPLGRL